MQLTLTPSDSALAQDRRYLPELALGAGFGITLLLGLSVHLARSARAGQRAAEFSNKKLFAENEERRRVEARLKVSDERLRLDTLVVKNLLNGLQGRRPHIHPQREWWMRVRG